MDGTIIPGVIRALLIVSPMRAHLGPQSRGCVMILSPTVVGRAQSTKLITIQLILLGLSLNSGGENSNLSWTFLRPI